MCHQGSQAGQEEEDKARDQDPAKPVWGAEHRRAARCGQRQSKQDT
jgi:hypothetical protein